MPIQVAVFIFDRVSPFHLSVPCVVFGEAARSAGLDDFEVRLCSEDGAKVVAATGFEILPQGGLETLDAADIVIFPSWPDPQQPPSRALLDAIHRADRRGATLVGLCLGAYALAYAGLLDNRSATTHWAYVEDFRRRFPAIRLQPNVLYQQVENVITSAGTAAAIDCCLNMLRDSHGNEQSNRVARLMVTAPHRTGGQAQFIELPIPEEVKDKRLAALLDEVRLHLAEPHTIDSLATKMAMSRRTFTRHFKALTGQTFTQWLLQERLRYCQTLLEQSDQSIDTIAQLAGFLSMETFRHHFKQRFDVSPSEWRKNFHASPPVNEG